jgi:hypothetical protein
MRRQNMKKEPVSNLTKSDLEVIAKELVKMRACRKDFTLFEVQDTPENRLLVAEFNGKYGGIFKCR